MATKLLDEYPLLIIPTAACIVGLHEAIVLQQVHYWLQNPKIGKRHKDRKWIECKLEEWQHDNFPFWHINTINRLLLKLKADGLLLTAKLNRTKMDQTLWYTIDYEKWEAMIQAHEDSKKEVSRFHQFGEKVISESVISNSAKLCDDSILETTLETKRESILDDPLPSPSTTADDNVSLSHDSQPTVVSRVYLDSVSIDRNSPIENETIGFPSIRFDVIDAQGDSVARSAFKEAFKDPLQSSAKVSPALPTGHSAAMGGSVWHIVKAGDTKGRCGKEARLLRDIPQGTPPCKACQQIVADEPLMSALATLCYPNVTTFTNTANNQLGTTLAQCRKATLEAKLDFTATLIEGFLPYWQGLRSWSNVPAPTPFHVRERWGQYLATLKPAEATVIDTHKDCPYCGGANYAAHRSSDDKLLTVREADDYPQSELYMQECNHEPVHRD